MDHAYLGICVCLMVWHAEGAFEEGAFEECASRMGALSVVYLCARVGLAVFTAALYATPPDAAVFCVVPAVAAACAYLRPRLALCFV